MGLLAEKTCHEAKDPSPRALRQPDQTICDDFGKLNCRQAERQRSTVQGTQGRPLHVATHQCSHAGGKDLDGLIVNGTTRCAI